jgi:hypothetical protein
VLPSVIASFLYLGKIDKKKGCGLIFEANTTSSCTDISNWEADSRQPTCSEIFSSNFVLFQTRTRFPYAVSCDGYDLVRNAKFMNKSSDSDLERGWGGQGPSYGEKEQSAL